MQCVCRDDAMWGTCARARAGGWRRHSLRARWRHSCGHLAVTVLVSALASGLALRYYATIRALQDELAHLRATSGGNEQVRAGRTHPSSQGAVRALRVTAPDAGAVDCTCVCALAQLRRQVGELEASKAVLERQLKERAGGWRNELEEASPLQRADCSASPPTAPSCAPLSAAWPPREPSCSARAAHC